MTLLVQFWGGGEGAELYYPYSGSVSRPNLGMGCGIAKETVFCLAMAEVRVAGLSCKRSGNAGQGHPPLPPPLPPRSRPLFDTDHPTALKRRHVTNIKDQLSFNRYNLLAFRGFLLYLADLHVRAIPEITKNLDTY